MVNDARERLQLIDDVARRMTDADAPGDLRARVLARLPAEPAPTFRGTLVMSGFAASVAALIVVGVIWSRHEAPSMAPPSVASNVEPHFAPAPQPSAEITDTAVTPRRLAQPRRAEVAVRRLPALEVETIQPERLSIAPLTVAPLVSEPLRIAAADGGGSER
jgi:hypothetical protein